MREVVLFGLAASVILAGLYIEFRIIHDCGFMALFQGAEWWWMFGYCN